GAPRVEVVAPAGDLEAVVAPLAGEPGHLLERQIGPLSGEQRDRSCHVLQPSFPSVPGLLPGHSKCPSAPGLCPSPSSLSVRRCPLRPARPPLSLLWVRAEAPGSHHRRRGTARRPPAPAARAVRPGKTAPDPPAGRPTRAGPPPGG